MIILSGITKKYAGLSIAYAIMSIGIVLFFWNSTALSSLDLSETGTHHALIIGISKYDHWPDLESPAKDAEAIKNILVSKYSFLESNITLLTDNTDEKPTAVNILRSLNRYLNTLAEKDNLLVFFAGRSEESGDNTYWIPADAHKDFITNWLNHSELCRKIFAGKNLRVNNLCILTDSFFSDQLLDAGEFVPLYPYDMRYPEKIFFKAKKKSREVISLNSHHFPPNETDGLGIFTYYIRNALLDNHLKIIDIENLVFDESVAYPIRRITGTKMKRGRLKDSEDDKGQFVLTRHMPLSSVDVAEAIVTSPEPSYPGTARLIEARIKEPERVKDVYLEFHNQRHPMYWNGFTWEYNYSPDKPEEIPFKIYALNDDDLEGAAVNIIIATVKRPAALTEILSAEVELKKGTEDTYIFSATTDTPAKELTLSFDGKPYTMKGKDSRWNFALQITDYGKKSYSMVAVNEEGAEGLPKHGTFYVKMPLVNLTDISAAPKTSHPEEIFTVHAVTERPAHRVEMTIDGKQYDMLGSGTDWHFEMMLPEAGRETISARAQNDDGEYGTLMDTEISIVPYSVAEVIDISPPVHIYAAEQFIIRVKTDEPAKSVVLSIDGKPHIMDGSEKEWKYTAVINKVGMNTLTAVAENRSGIKGNSYDKSIHVEKRTAKPINIETVSLTPTKGAPDQKFTFEIKTDQPAQNVKLTIDEKTHAMIRSDASGSFWNLKLQFNRPGDKDFTIVAVNAEGVEGSPLINTLRVSDYPVRVLSVKVSQEKGYLGEFFDVSAETDRPANKVYLLIGGRKNEMTGSDKKWSFRQKRDAAGKQQLIIIASNTDGMESRSKPVEITTVKQPLPEITSVKVMPEKIVVGDKVNIQISTKHDAHKVYIEIDGVRHEMQGSGTSWYYADKIDTIGRISCKIKAFNKNGQAAKSYSHLLRVSKLPEPVVHVTENLVNPLEGFPFTQFTFTVKTDKSAERVALVFDDGRYEMSGSKTEWTLTKQFVKLGNIRFYAVAVNSDKKEGQRKWAEFTVQEMKDRYKFIDDLTVLDRLKQKKTDRFIDNGNGTITDLYTSLMWLERPYTINGQTYDQAVDYCQDLDHKGLSGWRLPNIDEWKKMVPALSSTRHPFEEVTLIFPYWSKTSHRGRIYMKTMDLRNRKVSFQGIKEQGYVWPVRYVDLDKTDMFSQ